MFPGMYRYVYVTLWLLVGAGELMISAQCKSNELSTNKFKEKMHQPVVHTLLLLCRTFKIKLL